METIYRPTYYVKIRSINNSHVSFELGVSIYVAGDHIMLQWLGLCERVHDQGGVVLETSLNKISIDKDYYSLPIHKHFFLSKKDHVHIHILCKYNSFPQKKYLKEREQHRSEWDLRPVAWHLIDYKMSHADCLELY